MKKRILAALLAGALAVGMGTAAFAEGESETESAAYESYVVMNGFDGENDWTILLDSGEGKATVAIASSVDDVQALYGDYTVDDEGESFTISNEEDGKDYVFKYVENDNATVTFSNQDGSVSFDGVFVNPSIAEVINDYTWYAGKTSAGNSVTIGFDEEVKYLICGLVYADASEEDQFFGLGFDVDTGKAADTEGNEYDFSFEPSDESGLFATVNFDGEKIDMVAVNPGVFPEFESTEE